jgi:hypothetical protein
MDESPAVAIDRYGMLHPNGRRIILIAGRSHSQFALAIPGHSP